MLFLFFSYKKCSKTKLFNIFKILDHAHIVFSSISFIQMFQIITRKLLAFKTIFCLACLENYAIFYFAFDTSDGFIEVTPLQPGHLFLSLRYAWQIPQFIPHGAMNEVSFKDSIIFSLYFLFSKEVPIAMLIAGITRYLIPICVK